jgi:RNA polymerase sigma-70 factor (ECF subfamily)
MAGAPAQEDPEDDDLVRAWRGGDDGAFSALVERHGPRLHGFLLYLLRDPAAAEDAWSETFIRLVRARDRYQANGTFRAWLYTVARRCALDQQRSRRRWLRLASRMGEADPPERLQVPADDALEERERKDAVVAALGRLTEEQRAALLLTYRQGLNSSEVGEVLGLTGQQVRNKIAYARRLLGEMLEDGPESS